jgi:hypothetical protein
MTGRDFFDDRFGDGRPGAVPALILGEFGSGFAGFPAFRDGFEEDDFVECDFPTEPDGLTVLLVDREDTGLLAKRPNESR